MTTATFMAAYAERKRDSVHDIFREMCEGLTPEQRKSYLAMLMDGAAPGGTFVGLGQVVEEMNQRDAAK